MNVYVRELARELGRGGMYVDVFTRRASPDTPTVQWITDHVRVIQICAGPALPLQPNDQIPYVEEFTQRVARFAERAAHPYDMIHSHYWLSAVAGLRLAREWGIPHITMFHTVERLKGEQYGDLDAARKQQLTSAPGSAAQTRIEHEARIAAQVDRITVSTQHERDRLSALYRLPAQRLRIIPCGVDLQAFTPGTPRERQEARAYVAPGPTPTLLSVGRLDPIKGLDLLLESVAQMRTPARVIIVGGDPNSAHGDPEIERLRALAAHLGIDERVSFPGAAGQTELTRYYRAVDALVVTSRYESFGLVAVEALASGTPVIATAAGGLPSVITDGENGLLVAPRAANQFAERLDTLLTDDALRTRLAANARQSVERFDWRRIGDEVRAMYQELTADARIPELVEACSCF